MTQTLQPSWIQPPSFSPVYVPDLQTLHLSEAERETISRLQMRAWRQRQGLELRDSYYRGEQILTSLGIAMPPELEFLRVIVGWPRTAVDPFVERLDLDCFRVSNSTTADPVLSDVWTANGMTAEMTIAFTESLALGRAYYIVGPGDEPGDPPRITVESPMNMIIGWDLAGCEPKEALQSYWQDNRRHAALYTPNSTVWIAEDDNGQWAIVNRDDHNFGAIGIVRQANRARANDRDGASEITTELMSIVDQGCRTMANLAVTGEFYAAPRWALLGAAEDAFVATDGSSKSAWQTYIGRILAFERDEAGQVPQIHQFDSHDPTSFTKVIEMLAGQAAGITGALPQELGLYTQGNPVSADSYQVSEARRDRRVTGRMHPEFGPALVKTAQWAIRYMEGGVLPDKYRKLAADWVNPSLPNFTGVSDGLAKLGTGGFVPPGSDVARKRAGFSAVERAQLAKETDLVEEVIRQIGAAVEAKDVRAANALANAAKTTPSAPDAPTGAAQ